MSVNIPSPNLVLYAGGAFDAKALRESGFTTVILSALHVRPNGDLMYHRAAPIVSNGVFNAAEHGQLASLIQALKAPGSTVQLVLMSIGGSETTDFTNVERLLSSARGVETLRQNFRVLSKALGIDGYDFDDHDNFDVDTIASLTELLGADSVVTYCAFMDIPFWVQCLEKVYLAERRQLVRWINLPAYRGAGDPSPWARAVRASKFVLSGVEDGPGFIVPGFSAGNQRAKGQHTPAQLQSTFRALNSATPGLGGGMIWNLAQIETATNPSYTPGQYATAITAGLSANPTLVGMRYRLSERFRRQSSRIRVQRSGLSPVGSILSPGMR